LPVEVQASHLLYGSRKLTSNELRAVLRLTRFVNEIASGFHVSTKMRIICPFFVEHNS